MWTSRNSSPSSRKRRSLGQHYLVDRSVLGQMIDQAAISRGERVLEIGAGKGVLTTELLKVADRVSAYEIDRGNYHATVRQAASGRLDIRLGDAFLSNPRFDVLVSSLPYSESSTFVEWLARRRYDRAIVMLQLDFVDKLTAHPGSDAYRAVSVISQASSGLEVLARIERSAFQPPPRVWSALVRIRSKRTLTERTIHSIKRLFSQRRKTLAAALKRLEIESVSLSASELAMRVEDIPASDIVRILERVGERKGGPEGRGERSRTRNAQGGSRYPPRVGEEAR